MTQTMRGLSGQDSASASTSSGEVIANTSRRRGRTLAQLAQENHMSQAEYRSYLKKERSEAVRIRAVNESRIARNGYLNAPKAL